ncbi:MAG: hypothetical protein ACXWQO_06120 [Bdellovibrionota bacterium]
MRLPDRQEFLDYAEGTAGQSSDTQKQILKLLASSPVMREQLAELKRDLYLAAVQVPDYFPSTEFAAELTRLTQSWAQLAYTRKFSLKNFYRSREFFGLILFLVAAAFLLLAGVGIKLMK